MKNYIGNVIRELRISKNITQKELAFNICTVRQLARIEANTSSPSAFILTEISNRLGNTLSHYIPFSMDKNVYEIGNLTLKLHKLFDAQKYHEVYKLIKENDRLTNTSSLAFKQEIQWFVGALNHYIDVEEVINVEYFLNILKENLKINSLDDLFTLYLKPIDYRILNSLIVEYLNEGNYGLAETILVKSIENFERNYNHIKDTSYLRMLYNLSRLYLIQNCFELALKISDKGIQHAIKNSSFAYLAGLNNIHGRALFKLNREEEGKKHMINYINLCRLTEPSFDYENIISTLIKKYNIDLT